MLQLTSIPFLLSTRRMQSTLSTLTEAHRESQVEAVTGRVHSIGKELEGDVGRVHRLERFIHLAEKRDQAMTALQGELSIVQLTLTTAREKSESLALRIQGALGINDENALAAHASEAGAELEALFGHLNTSYGGKHLFSGAAVETTPLADASTMLTALDGLISSAADATTAIAAIDTYFGAGGAFETTIYQGSTSAGPTREISEGRRVGVEATPIDIGLKNTIRGLAVVALARSSATTTEIGDALLADAAGALGRAGQQIMSQQAEIGAIEEDVAISQIRNAASKFAYEENLTALIGRDQYEAATRMTNLETQIEAAYLATSRIANLTLVNFLR